MQCNWCGRELLPPNIYVLSPSTNPAELIRAEKLKRPELMEPGELRFCSPGCALACLNTRVLMLFGE